MSFNDVMREFQRRGIDNEAITEYVAFLLLIYKYDPANWDQLANAHPQNLQTLLEQIVQIIGADKEPVFPQSIPHDSWVDGLYRVLNPLRALVKDFTALGLGQFFQQQVRYHLLRDSRGERYPTPHHIATFMAQILLPEKSLKNASVFDPTCGTGGLLVAAHQFQPDIEFVGCDYNSRWARLAYANLRLNGVANFTIQPQAAQQFQNFDPQKGLISTNRLFDYVLMNPPFDSGVVFDLIALAIHSLLKDGQAALLAPSGVVQRSDDRVELLKNGLQAVITLPPDAFRPYNGIRSHILLLDKANRFATVWLCLLQADGYGTGMARPLDQPAYPGASELPRTLALCQQQRETTWPFALPLDNGAKLEVISLPPANDMDKHPGGLALRFTGINAKPVTWAACHLTSGALIWWEQTNLLSSEQLIYAGYKDRKVVPLQRTKTEEVTWRNLSRTAGKKPEFTEWQVEEANISLTWATNSLTLKQSGRNSFADLHFAKNSKRAGGACLLDETGRRISNWYGADLPEQVQKVVQSVGQALYDSDGITAAWLLPLTANDKQLTLLLIKQSKVSLFAPGGPHEHYGLLWQAGNGEHAESGGVWLLDGYQLITTSGSRINCNLRTPEGKSMGIAFGPQPDNVGEASLFGVYVAQAILQGQSLEPERYLPETRPTVALQSPAQVLAKIRQQQRVMESRIDALLSALGQGTLQIFVDALPLLSSLPLNEAQQTLWYRLKRQEKTYLSLTEIEDVGSEDGLLTKVEVRQQIELLISLGLLLPVTVEGQNLYRCVRHSDLVEVKTA